MGGVIMSKGIIALGMEIKEYEESLSNVKETVETLTEQLQYMQAVYHEKHLSVLMEVKKHIEQHDEGLISLIEVVDEIYNTVVNAY